MKIAEHNSDRPHGRLFTKYEIRVEALPADDSEIVRIIEQLDELLVTELLVAVARQIERAIPDVRVEIVG